MADEVASLGLKVEASGIQEANDSLNELTQAATKAEKAIEATGSGAAKTGKTLASLGQGAGRGLETVGTGASNAQDGIERLGKSADVAEKALKRVAATSGQIGDLSGDFKSVSDSMARLNQQLATTINGMGEFGESFKKTSKNANDSATSITKFFAAAAAGVSVWSVIDMADDWGQMASRVQMATKSQDEYNLVMQRTAASAKTTYRDVNEVRELFILSASSIQALGYSLEQTLTLQESFSNLLVTNSASAERGASAIDALSSALISGAVSGEDWKRITTAMPTLIDRMSDATGKSAEQIKLLGKEGKIALSDFTKTLLETAAANKEAADAMPATVREAIRNASTGLKEFLGYNNQATGATQALVGGLNLLGNNMNVVATAGAAVAVVMGARLASSLALSTIEFTKNAASATATSYSLLRSAAAGSTAATSFATLGTTMRAVNTALTPFGGAFGAILTAAGLVATAMYAFRDSNAAATQTLIAMGDPIDEVTKKLEGMEDAQRKVTTTKLLDQQITAVQGAQAAWENFAGVFLTHAMNAGMSEEAVNSLWKELEKAKTEGAALLPFIDRLAASGIVNEKGLSNLTTLAAQYQTVAKVAADAVAWMERLNSASSTPTAGAANDAANLTKRLEAEAAAMAQGAAAYKSKAQATQDLLTKQTEYRTMLVDLEARGLGATASANTLRDAIKGIGERMTGTGKSASSAASSVDDMTRAYQNSVKSLRDRISAEQMTLEILQKYGKEAKNVTAIDKEVFAAQKNVASATTAKAKAYAQEILNLALLAQAAEKATKAEQDRLDLIEAFNEAKEQGLKTAQADLKSIQDQVKAQEEANRAIGLSTAQLAVLEAAKYRDMAASKRRLAEQIYNADGDTQEAENYRKAADELERLAMLKEDGAMRQANLDAQKEIAAEWDKTSQLIGQTLSDYIMGGGKDAAQYLKRLFATLVLQPIVNYGVQGVMGALGMGGGGGGMPGMPGQGGGMNLSGIGSSINGLSNLWSNGSAAWEIFTYNNQWLGTGMSAANAMGTASANAAGTGLDGLLASNGAYGTAAGTGLSSVMSYAPYIAALWQIGQGNYGSGAGMAAGAYAGSAFGPIGTAIGAVIGGLIGSFADFTATPHMGARGYYNNVGGEGVSSNVGDGETKYNEQIGQSVEDLATAVGTSFSDFLGAFGMDAIVRTEAAWADDFNGKGNSWGDLVIAMQDATGEWVDLVNWSAEGVGRFGEARHFKEGDEGFTEYMEAVMQGYVQALTKVDLPSWATDMLESIGDDASMEQINQTLMALGVMRETFTHWNESLVEFANVGDDAFSTLLNSVGGFEGLSSGVASFIELFYSDAEKLDMAQSQLQKELDKFDLKLPELDMSDVNMDSAEEVKAAWRAMVADALAAGEEGADLAAMLLNLGPAFAQTADASEAAALAEAELAQAREDAHKAQIDGWMSLGGLSVQSMSQGVMNALQNGEDPGAWLAEHITGGFEQAMQMQALNMVMQRIMDEALAPAMEEIMTDLFGERGDATATTAEQAVLKVFDAMDAAFASVTGDVDAQSGGLLSLDTSGATGGMLTDYSGSQEAVEVWAKGLAAMSTEAVTALDMSEFSAALTETLSGIVDPAALGELMALLAELPTLEGDAAAEAQQAMGALFAGLSGGAMEVLMASGFVDAAFGGMSSMIIASSGDMLNAAATASMASSGAAVGHANAAISTIDGAIEFALSSLNSLLSSDLGKELFGSIKVPTKPVVTAPRQSYGGGGGDAASSINTAADSFKRISESLQDVIEKWRLDVLGTGANAQSNLEAEFAILTAQARAGDEDAAAKLPDIMSKLIGYTEQNSATMYDQMLAQVGYMNSLDETSKIIAKLTGAVAAAAPVNNFQYWDPARQGIASYDVGTARVPGTGLAILHKDERVFTPMENDVMVRSVQGINQGWQSLVSGIESLRSQLAEANARLAAIEGHAGNTADSARNTDRTMSEVTNGGDGMVLAKGSEVTA